MVIQIKSTTTQSQNRKCSHLHQCSIGIELFTTIIRTNLIRSAGAVRWSYLSAASAASSWFPPQYKRSASIKTSNVLFSLAQNVRILSISDNSTQRRIVSSDVTSNQLPDEPITLADLLWTQSDPRCLTVVPEFIMWCPTQLINSSFTSTKELLLLAAELTVSQLQHQWKRTHINCTWERCVWAAMLLRYRV